MGLQEIAELIMMIVQMLMYFQIFDYQHVKMILLTSYAEKRKSGNKIDR